MELSRTYAAHAVYTRGEERSELWRAAAVVDELLTSVPEIPHWELLIAQRAMVPAVQGRELRWRVELFPLNESARTSAISVLEDALARLGRSHSLLEQTLSGLLSRPVGQRQIDADLLPHRLKGLSRDVEFQWAESQLDLAKVLPVGPQRTAALERAAERFHLLTRIARPDEIAWNSRVSLIEILRIQQQGDLVPARVTSLLTAQPPAAIRSRAIAELVQSQLAQGAPATALTTLKEHRQASGTASDELDALLVESLLAARRMVQEQGDTVLAEDLLKQTQAVANRVQGPWGVRSRLLLERAAEADLYGPALSEAAHQAKWAQRNGRGKEAIDWYLRAMQMARTAGQQEFAAEFAMSAARAMMDAERFAEAVSTLEPLAASERMGDDVAEADLLRAYALGRLYEQQPTSDRQDVYRAALEEHRRRFVLPATRVQATWMLARLEEHAGEWTRALTLYGEIPAAHPDGPAAQARVAGLYESLLQRLRDRKQPVADWERRAHNQLREYVRGFPPPPARLSLEQASIAVILSRMLLDQEVPDFAGAGSLLDRVLQTCRVVGREATRDGGTPGADWQTLFASAAQLRVVAYAGEGQMENARRSLNELALAAPAQMLNVLAGLTEVAERIELQHRQALAQMQLELSKDLEARRDQLDRQAQSQLDECLAEAYAAAGDTQAAAAVYEKILWQQPDDRGTLRALARLYGACATRECQRNALEIWTRLEKLSARGTQDWLEARYHMAECAHLAGDDETARKLIGLTRVLYPDLGTPLLKQQYEQLDAKLPPPR